MTSSKWAAELEVDTTLAHDLIAEQFAELRDARVEPFGVGWDNTAFLIDGELVFRFPRRAAVVPILQFEIAVLPGLAPRLPLAIPEPTFVGKPSGRYPWPFAGYRLLVGHTACQFVLDPTFVAPLIAPLADFLERLHSIGEAEGRALGADADTREALDTAGWKQRAAMRLAEAEAARWMPDGTAWRAILESTSTDGPPTRSTLCHGDLYVRHLLLDGARALCGVIDWGDVHVGDPAVDLMIAWMLFDSEARQRFWDAYGAATAREREMSRLRAICHAVGTLEYALEVGDGDLERVCRYSLANALDD